MENKEKTVTEETKTAIDEAELSDKEAGILVHRFAEPFTFEGMTYTTLRFDFGKLTGRDGTEVEKEMTALGNPVIYRKVHAGYLLAMAARACDVRIGTDIFDAMRINDKNRIQDFARDFFV